VLEIAVNKQVESKHMEDSKLFQVHAAIIQLHELADRFDELLDGFKLYDEYKGNLDIDVYEKALELYRKAMNAMNEQCKLLHAVANCLDETLKN
jgi:hypothetical protein